MTRTIRTPTLWIASIAVAGFGAVAVASYKPISATDRALAVDTLRNALASLDDGSLDSGARLKAYRNGLAETEILLRRALLPAPLDSTSIERLATVRWEAGVLMGGPEAQEISALMAIAATRAPRVPEIQAGLGELLCKMGRIEDAGRFLRRAVELSPSMTNRVVATLINAGLDPESIWNALPRAPHVLIALKGSFLAVGRGTSFLDLVERDLDSASPGVLATYGEACLQLRAPDRLKARLAELEVVQDRAVVAERARQKGHAAFALGDLSQALELADAARRAMPTDPSYDEFFGDIALAAGHSTDAGAAFRSALSGVVEVEGPARTRARLYRKIGQAVETEGRGDLALDAYRHAVSLDETEAYAAARLAALDASISGVTPK